jgi:hypothetical protein
LLYNPRVEKGLAIVMALERSRDRLREERDKTFSMWAEATNNLSRIDIAQDAEVDLTAGILLVDDLRRALLVAHARYVGADMMWTIATEVYEKD